MNPNHQWAYRLKAKEEAGYSLPEFSRNAWREVLKKDLIRTETTQPKEEHEKIIKQYKLK